MCDGPAEILFSACGQNWRDSIFFSATLRALTNINYLNSIDILILMKPTKIPPEIFTKTIPSPNLFVSDIQKFPPAKTKSPSPQPLKQFLSHLTPNITDIDEIILLPTPSEAPFCLECCAGDVGMLG
jgi:hypothetical protein